jgi:hypothetical protein
MTTTIDDCTVLSLPKILRREGSITPIEQDRGVPFDIQRVYYLYDVPGGEARGGHAHRELQQLIVSVIGAFDVVVDDGRYRKTVTLNRAYQGLYVPRLIWRELVGFSSGGVCLVLASLPYDEADYIRNYESFVEHRESFARPVS